MNKRIIGSQEDYITVKISKTNENDRKCEILLKVERFLKLVDALAKL